MKKLPLPSEADVSTLRRIDDLELSSSIPASLVTICLLAIIARLLLRIAAKP